MPRPFPSGPARVLAALLALTVAGSAAGRSAGPQPSLSDAERQRAADAQAEAQAALFARGTAAEERRLAQARVDAAARLRGTETHLSELSARLDASEAERATVEARLHEEAGRLSGLLPLVQRLARYPAETVLAVPLASDDAVRGLVVLRGLATVAGAEAARLRGRQDELARAEAAVAASLATLRGAQQSQAVQSAQLDAQLSAARLTRAGADGAAADAARRAAASAAQAGTVRAMLAQIEADHRAAEIQAQADAEKATRQKREADAVALRNRRDELQRPPPAGPLRTAAGQSPAAAGQLLVPVAGSLLHGWGDRTEAGQSSGISYATPPGARVVAPCGGRVAFAGPFRSFGELLIVDCGGGLHAVLAGFERLDVPVGRAVLAGEPVGVMGTAARPALYVELRRAGQPINPAPFLRSHGNPSAL